MRAVLTFGNFRMWDYKIKEEDIGKPITIMHPMERLDITNSTYPSDVNMIPPLKRMEFEYKQRLDYDLVEYTFKRED